VTAGQFDSLQAALLGRVVDRAELRGPHLRLLDAWQSSESGASIRCDVAALIGQVLKHHRATTGDNRHLDVRLDARGIDRSVLERAGLKSASLAGGFHRVTIDQDWGPAWLQGDLRWVTLATSSPARMRLDNGVSIETYARPEVPVRIDPAIRALAPSVVDYRSRTQASAVRTVALAPPGATIHVVLPTGSGKSIVGLAPGLLHPNTTTVVVVPTTALALDQERQTYARFPRAGLPSELAYYGDRPPAEKEAIKHRLAAGTQRVVFTSPEALVSGLAPALQQLASNGGLGYVVIDEAHLVRSWGLGFRPEFQLAAAVFSELQQVAAAAGHQPPKTVLMTATLSEEGLRLNETLFGGEQSLFVGSTFLRTELRYLLSLSASEDERHARIVEALLHLPRPVIVYTTRKDAAEQLRARLQEAGFGRTVAFHGDVGDHERLRILRDWSGDGKPTAVDVVIGTTAFGLGVDQADVRTVLHACVPGSLDRFYQEVGRAGRDGHSALSIWMAVPGVDRRDARRIEGATVIGDDKAWNRWESMRLKSQTTDHRDAGVLVVDTDVIPPHVVMASDQNRLWNRNTLMLLQRARILDLQPVPAPDLRRQYDESDEQWQQRWSQAWKVFRNHVVVRLDPAIGNLDRATFESALERVRREVDASESDSTERIDRLLDLDECWGTVIAEEYNFADTDGLAASQHVSASCSGCPAVHHHGPSDYQAARPIVPSPGVPQLARALSAALNVELHGRGSLIVTYPDNELRRTLGDVVQTCVNHGIRAILAASEVVDQPAIAGAHTLSPEGFVMVDVIEPSPQVIVVPTLIVVSPGSAIRRTWLPPTEGPARILLVPEGIRDLDWPDSTLAEARSPALRVNDFLRRV
jgi:ATP-dependent DNA helicase RecQ